MPWLEIHNFNGKDYYAMMPERPTGLRGVSLGQYRYIEITKEEAALPLDKLIRLFRAEKEDQEKALAAAKAQAKARDRLESMKERFTRIINESSQKGEVENAKSLWEKITGKPWEGAKGQAEHD